MKKILHLLLIGIIFFYSCSTKSPKVENDLKKEGLKGDVILVVSDEGGWELNFNSYNSNGNYEILFRGSKELLDYNISEYKYLNEIVTSVTENGTLYKYNPSVDLFEYDNNNRLIKRRNRFFNYDDKNRLIKDSISIDRESFFISNNFYNSENNIDSTISIFHISKDDVNYTVKKNNLEYSYKLGKNGEKIINSTTNFYYNEYNDKIKEQRSGVESDPDQTFQYVYDRNNNWTKKEVYENGKLKNTINRKIYYKGDDVQSVINEMDNLITYIENKSKTKKSTQTNTKSKIRDCSICKGIGSTICYTCNGSSIQNCPNHKGPDCRLCKGSGLTPCYSCTGGRKYCQICRGTGKIED